MNEEKCYDCSFKEQVESIFNTDARFLCMAPVCIKDFQYDTDTRTYIPIKENTRVSELIKRVELLEGKLSEWETRTWRYCKRESELKIFHDLIKWLL